MRVAIALILIFVALVGGVTCLQIFLSTRKHFWFGLILPVLSLAFFMFCLFLLIPIFESTLPVTSYSPASPFVDASFVKNTVFIITAVLYNIPTVGLLITLATCRYCMHMTRKQVISELNAQIVSDIPLPPLAPAAPTVQDNQSNDHSN